MLYFVKTQWGYYICIKLKKQHGGIFKPVAKIRCFSLALRFSCMQRNDFILGIDVSGESKILSTSGDILGKYGTFLNLCSLTWDLSFT